MKFRLTVLASTLLIISAHQAFAVASNAGQPSLQQIDSEMMQLENQVGALQSQVKTLKQELKLKQKNSGNTKVVIVRESASAQQGANGVYGHSPYPSKDTSDSTINAHRKYLPSYRSPLPTTGASYQNVAYFLGGVPVMTSPYIGIHSAFDGSDLLINAPSVNLDVRLLRQTQALQDKLANDGAPLPQHPFVELSGKLEAQAWVNKLYPGRTVGDIDLSTTSLEVLAQVNPWIRGFMQLGYDNSRVAPVRTSNSRFFLQQGFITIGDFSRSHFYSSFGQLFVPFGQYSSFMLTPTLAQLLGQTLQRAIVIGYNKNPGPFGAIYVFHGDIRHSSGTQSGINLGYQATSGKLTATGAIGFISSLANAGGFQGVGAPPIAVPANIPFNGFGQSFITERLRHDVPGFDANAQLSYGHFNLIGEYVTATRGFDPLDLTFNSLPGNLCPSCSTNLGQLEPLNPNGPNFIRHSAKPQAGHIEAIYTFRIHDRPGNFGFGYDWTQQALALFLPKERWYGVFNISLWRDTVESVEFRHDINYPCNVVASGANSALFGPTYKTANTVTFQFGVYF